jgi:uracil-DNA glycosylase
MAPEKRGIQSFFAPVAKKPKATEAVEPPPAPVSNAVGASPAKSPGKNASKRPAETAGPGDGLTEAQRQRAELNKQVAMSKQLQRKATEVWEAARNAGETPDLDALLVEQTWRDILEGEFKKEYMSSLKSFLKREWNSGAKVFPAPGNIFRAFNTCPMERVKVVILGQDPYHDDGQAMGLSFSVPRGWKVPSSLQNIFKELGTDLGCSKPTHGDLDKWATQGVLMLNASLTVRAHQANSHSKKGWETFTDAAVRALAKNRSGLVFLLWGKNAQEKERLIDKSKGHKVLKSPHPSGLSAHRGFYGCKHFSQANAFIESKGGAPIDWQIV